MRPARAPRPNPLPASGERERDRGIVVSGERERIGTNGAELVTTYQYQTLGDHEIVTVTDPEGKRLCRIVCQGMEVRRCPSMVEVI